MHAPAGSIVGVAHFVRDARGPPLAAGHMAVDADQIDNGATKGKAVVVLHAWKDHLWILGFKGELPDALPIAVAAVGDKQTSGVATRKMVVWTEMREALAHRGAGACG